MKTLIFIAIFLVGGWYYLVNYHYAIDSDNQSIELYTADEHMEDSGDSDYTAYEEKDTQPDSTETNRPYHEKQDTVVETQIHHSIYDEKASAYKCDGRTRCSEMRSCAEAKFFLANCKNVIMDGDKDGVPCESQWCGGGMVY